MKLNKLCVNILSTFRTVDITHYFVYWLLTLFCKKQNSYHSYQVSVYPSKFGTS